MAIVQEAYDITDDILIKSSQEKTDVSEVLSAIQLDQTKVK